jgi:hypothetical protein
VATLLEPPREILEEFAPSIDRYSAIEGEILVLLKRPAMYPQSLKELRNELTPLFLNTIFGKVSAI